MIQKSDIKDMYFLSPMQEGMLFHFLENKNSYTYFEQMSYAIAGQLDLKLFTEAFIRLVEHHDILRTIFIHEKLEKPLQIVLKKRKAKIAYHDISHLAENERDAFTKDFMQQDKRTGFNLSGDIPIRLSVLKTAPGSHLVTFSFHHIILDGWSVGLIFKELLQVYEALRLEKPVTLPPVSQYKDYIKWIENQDKKKGLEYWQNYLEGYEKQATLPKSFIKNPSGDHKQAAYSFLIDEKYTAELLKLSMENDVTQNTILQALWGILLCKYNRLTDVVFGTIVSGRPSELPAVGQVVGLFLNNVPFRVKLEGEKPFNRFIKEIQEKELLSKSFEYLPLAEIQSKSILKEKLIDHIFVFENYPISRELRNTKNKEGLGFEVREQGLYEETNYDCNIIIAPGTTMQVKFQYNALVYDEPLIRQIAGNFEEMIFQALADPQIAIDRLGKISPRRKAALIAHGKENLEKEVESFQHPDDTMQKKLHESFRVFKDRIALEQGSRTMTYEQLEQRSMVVARWLMDKKIKKETFIGILLEDRMEVIVTAVGILRAGCVMAPFYSTNPIERIAAMANAIDLDHIFIDDFNFERFKTIEPQAPETRDYIFIKDLHLSQSSSVNQDCETNIAVTPDDRMYIHFTSGTTGVPKAIVGKNKSLLHFINWETGAFKISPRNRTAQFTIPGFDPFLRDVFVPLLSGGTVCIPENYDILMDSTQLKEWVNKNRITLIHCVSSLFRLLAADPLEKDDFPALESIMLAGEKIHPTDLVTWYETFGERIQLANCYGPTETTMSKVCHFIQPGDLNREKIPIGKPIKGARVFIMDEKMDICDELGAGEICIRTPYRSWGYYNDPRMNGQKFIINPFNNDPNDIIYRSGDLGRWLPDGNLDILGRIDRQVKIRGYRIELEEIESLLCKHPAVKEAALIQEEISPGNFILCAFIAGPPGAANRATLETGHLETELKEYMGGKLPDYMVPARIIEVEPIPRRATGKVDFPKLAELYRQHTADTIEPRNPIEEKLSRLWADVLRIEKAGLFTRFFDLGGNSLNVMTLISRIHREFDVRISLQDFFNNPTIEKQAQVLEKTLGKTSFCPIKKAEEKLYYPLTPAQQRIFMMQQLEPDSTAYNLPFSYILEGDLHRRRLEETFNKLIQRHEMLRTSFKLMDGEPVQQVHSQVHFEVGQFQLGAGNFVRPFDLSCAPLLRVGFSEIEHFQDKRKGVLMIDIHHIAADGVSLGLLLKEFMILYEDRQLPPLTLQYKDFAQWQNDPQQVESRKKQGQYWLREFAEFDQIKPLNLRPDYERPGEIHFEGSTFVFEIQPDQINALKTLAMQEETTLFTVLLAIYIIMLAKISGQGDFAVGMLSAGRIHTDLDNIIGMFVNTLALRCRYHGEMNFVEYLAAIKKKSLEAFENQDFQFEDLVRELGVERVQNRNPLFDTMFVHQDLGLQELKIPGLELKPNELETKIAKFDLTMNCVGTVDNYRFHIEYSTQLFKKEKIERYAGYFKQVLANVVENCNQKLDEINAAHEYSTVAAQKVGIDFDF
ncbi:MAG: amino acid adenylation domain-containing protein [Acidobacteria bacterium]|jgi:fengycin family lipopeptide synthetase D|nr:amino acid adenylation domain-containing protein [Acidobacteriota bacterium]